MGVDLNFTTKSWAAGKKDWLAHSYGMDTCRSVTLNLGLFVSDHFPNGFIPSGTVLGLVTASKLYGPYNNALSTGVEVARGFLFEDVEMESGWTHSVGAAMLWQGIVVRQNLPNFTGAANNIGELDSAAEVDLAATIRFEDLNPIP